MRKILPFLFLFISHNTMPEVILWDIHNVILQRSGTMATIWNFPHTKKMLQHISWPLIKTLVHLGWKQLSEDLSSETYVKAARDYNNPYLIQFIIAISNAQRPVEGIHLLLEELSEDYEQHIASNIGTTAFKDLVDSEKNPQFKHLFKYMDVDNASVTSYENGVLIKKPDPVFFRDYLKRNNLDPDQDLIILIDDRANNVSSARKLGLKGIIFKNTLQLRQALIRQALKKNL